MSSYEKVVSKMVIPICIAQLLSIDTVNHAVIESQLKIGRP